MTDNHIVLPPGDDIVRDQLAPSEERPFPTDEQKHLSDDVFTHDQQKLAATLLAAQTALALGQQLVAMHAPEDKPEHPSVHPPTKAKPKLERLPTLDDCDEDEEDA